MKNSQKGFIVPLLLGIIALLVIGGGVYVYTNKKTQTSVVSTDAQQTNTQTPSVITQTNSQINISNWKTYKNEEKLYEFSYPSYATISETKSAVTDTTVVLTPDWMNTFDVTTDPEPAFCANNPYKNMAVANPQLIKYTEDKINKYGNEYRHLHETDSSSKSQIITEDRYYLVKNNTCYMITGKTSSKAQDLIVLDVGKIFSTFKFTKMTPMVNATLSAESILNLSNDSLIAGGVRWSGYHLSVDANRIIFGDLDGDGINEAIAPVGYCSASCGMSVYVFKLYQGKILVKEIPETSVAGAAQKINSLQIKNGRVEATVSDFGGTRTNSYYIEVVNGRLMSTAMVSPSP